MAPPPPSVPFISLRTLSHLSWYRGRLYSQQFFKQQTWDPWKVKVLVAQSCPTLATPWTATRQAHLSMGFSRQEYWSELSPAPGDLPYPRIGGSYHCRWTPYHLSHQWIPTVLIWCGILQARILEWVAVPFSRGSSQSKDRTQVFCIAGGFFTSWATRELWDPWNQL